VLLGGCCCLVVCCCIGFLVLRSKNRGGGGGGGLLGADAGDARPLREIVAEATRAPPRRRGERVRAVQRRDVSTHDLAV